MDISKLIGLGILGYILLTSKMKVELGPSYKELEDKTKDLEDKNEDLEEKLKETYEELDQYTEKEEEDLVIKPELHIDIDGGICMSYLYLNIKNNSTKLSYKIGDFSAHSIVALAYTANTFEPKKAQTLTIKPGKSYRLLIWSRNLLKQGYFNKYNEQPPRNLVFMPPQSTYFGDDAFNEITTFVEDYRLHKIDHPDFEGRPACFMCFESPDGLLIKQLNATVYSSNDEKQEKIFNDIKGSLFIYATGTNNGVVNRHFPDYNNLTGIQGYSVMGGPVGQDGYGTFSAMCRAPRWFTRSYYNPETQSWEASSVEWIGENTHVFK